MSVGACGTKRQRAHAPASSAPCPPSSAALSQLAGQWVWRAPGSQRAEAGQFSWGESTSFARQSRVGHKRSMLATPCTGTHFLALLIGAVAVVSAAVGCCSEKVKATSSLCFRSPAGLGACAAEVATSSSTRRSPPPSRRETVWSAMKSCLREATSKSGLASHTSQAQVTLAERSSDGRLKVTFCSGNRFRPTERSSPRMASARGFRAALGPIDPLNPRCYVDVTFGTGESGAVDR